MKYAIEMYFDQNTEDKIMSLAQKVADYGFSTKFLEWKTKPHVTLAIFNDVDEQRCIELLQEFTRGKAQFLLFSTR
jgi:2'-5' RNA ligase